MKSGSTTDVILIDVEPQPKPLPLPKHLQRRGDGSAGRRHPVGTAVLLSSNCVNFPALTLILKKVLWHNWHKIWSLHLKGLVSSRRSLSSCTLMKHLNIWCSFSLFFSSQLFHCRRTALSSYCTSSFLTSSGFRLSERSGWPRGLDFTWMRYCPELPSGTAEPCEKLPHPYHCFCETKTNAW